MNSNIINRHAFSYCIALVPPEPSLGKLKQLQTDLASLYKIPCNQNFQPCILLIEPFIWDNKKEYLLTDALKKFAHNHFSVEIEVNGFLNNEKAVQLNILEKPVLNEIQKQLKFHLDMHLKLIYGPSEPEIYHPYLDLAFSKKSKLGTKKLVQKLQDFEFNVHFIANNFSLFRYETDHYKQIADFYLE
ncbi:MAG: hypothetical protein V4643_11260 [Bacteroidota bacterium]